MHASASGDTTSSGSDIVAMQQEKCHEEVRNRIWLFSRPEPDQTPQAHHLVPMPKQHSESTETKGPCKASVIKSADEAYDYLVQTGCAKNYTPIWRTVWLGILAGVYIGIGYALASVVAGQVCACCAVHALWPLSNAPHSSSTIFGKRGGACSTCSTALLACLLA